MNGVEFWWFLRELCRVAKVDRGKEHSLLMHQCTTEVLCNLAGLIFGLAFHPSSFLLKPISFLSKAGVFLCIISRTLCLCAFECEIILV